MKYLDLFLDHLRLNHKAESTINGYRSILKKVKEYFNEKKLQDDKLVNENDIIECLKHFKAIKHLEWMYPKLIIALRIYFQFLVDSNIIFLNPAINIENEREIKNHIKPLDKEQVFDSLNKIRTDNDYGIRSKAILELLYSTGIRPFELANIKLNHIDFNKKELFIEKGKMSKDRVVPIGDTALNWIEKYIKEVRPKNLKDKTVNYLFITLIGKCKKLSSHGLYDAIKYTFSKFKIKRFKPYALRSSCATHCLINGMDILHIQKMLGHSSILTTKGYLHVDTLNLQDILKINHPRNKY